MSKAFKKYKFLIIIFSNLFIFVLCITTIPTNYDAYVPGSVEKVGAVVEIKTDDKSENYYSTSVSYIEKVTLFQKFIFKNIKQGLVYKRSPGMTSEKDYLQGEIEHNSAIYTSLISAYKEANVYLDYKFVGYYVFDTNSKNLYIGDVVIGSSIDDCKEKVLTGTFNVLRMDGKETKEVEVSLNSGDWVDLNIGYDPYPYYEISDENISIYPSNNGGPSAGFMQSLKLYDDLVEEKLGENLKIAGTGTIDDNGNVGAIGCVGLKIYTAMYNKCDIFFIPEENRIEAEKYLKNIKTKMKIVYVNTLSEAITYLRGI